MVVIRNGKPVKVGGGAAAEAAEEDSEEDEEPKEPERFSREEKKCRALRKQLRGIAALRISQRDGIELDAQQKVSVLRSLYVLVSIRVA